MVFQLCPTAAAEGLLQPQRSCNFEGLFGAVPKAAAAAEVPPNLFHRVAELVSDSRVCFQMALEAGKLPSSCLPPRRRSPGAVVDPTLRAAAPFNNDLFRLVGSLSSKRLINLSFDEAAEVEALVMGLIDSQSMFFWLFSTFLHWLRELGFVPVDAAGFEQLVQSLSSFVNVASVVGEPRDVLPGEAS